MNSDELATLIDEKCAVLEQLHSLAQRQANLVADGDMERLLNVLVAKQRLLAGLHDVEARLSPYRQEDPERRVWRSADQRQRTRQSADRCEQLLRATLDLEQRCESEMVRRRDETARQLQGVQTAAMARDAYSKSPSPSRGCLDLSSES